MEVPSKTRQRLSGDFWRFWFGQTVSNLGSAFTQFALPLLIFKITGSAVSLGLAMAAAMLPYLLFGLLIGAYTDRVDRKRMMIATDILRAAVISVIPLLAAMDALTVWWIYGVSFVSTTLTIFFDSGEFAAIPSLVSRDDLVSANGRIQASYATAQVLGPLLAGALVALVSVSNLMLFDAATFLLSAASLMLVRKRFNEEPGEEREPSTLLRDVKEGLSYVLNHPVLRNISLMMAIVNFISASAFGEVVLFAKDRLHATDTGVAILFASGSLGIAVIALFAGRIRKRWVFSKVALAALTLDGIFLMGFSFTRSLWLAVPLWALSSGFGILFNINTGSLRQAIVPNQMLGRVMSVASVLAWSAIPLGAIAGGWAIETTRNPVLVYVVIAACVIALPNIFRFTALGRAEDYLPEDDRSEPTSLEIAPTS